MKRIRTILPLLALGVTLALLSQQVQAGAGTADDAARTTVADRR